MRMIELQNKTDNGLLVANQQRRGIYIARTYLLKNWSTYIIIR